MAAEALDGYPVVVPIPVAWGDMDALSHVNNTVYFRYIETGRIAYFAAIGLGAITTATNAVGPILAETGCRFRRPVTFPDTVDVGVRVAEIVAGRVRMEHIIVSRAQATVVTTGFGVVVTYDYATGRRVPVPDGIVAAIEGLQGPVPVKESA